MPPVTVEGSSPLRKAARFSTKVFNLLGQIEGPLSLLIFSILSLFMLWSLFFGRWVVKYTLYLKGK
jgi:hypothetical protein